MAEKIVKGVDIVEKGALSEHIEQAKQLLVVYSQLDIEVKSTATSLSKISKGFKATKTGDIGTAKATSDNMTKAMLEQERIAQAQIRTKKALLQLEKAQETQANRTAKAVANENNAYTKQSKELNNLRNQYKNLAAQNQSNTKEARALLAEITKLDAKLKGIDKTVGQSQRNVGNYTSALDKLKGVGIGVTNMLGQLGLAMGVGMITRDAFNTIVEYDEKLADIVKTTGLTIEGARELTDALLQIDTRSSVTALQEMAVSAGRLGIEGKQNIIDFVDAADKAFVALGDDLGGTADEIATALGKVAGVYGDESKFGVGQAILKTGSLLNGLSSASKASAANILDFTNRLAGVSAVSGIAQSDIQALGAFFDESGQSIEVAATTLNVLLPKLASDQERFAKVAGMTADEFGKILQNNPIEALKAVAVGAKSSEGGLNGLVKTLEDFGIESARGASIVGVLSNNTERLTELQKIGYDLHKEGTNVLGEFNTKNETTGAILEKLAKEWDKQVLGIGGTTKASNMLKGALQFLVKNLGTILEIVFKLGKAFVFYKTTMLAIQGITKAQILIEQIRTKGLSSMFVQQTSVNQATAQGSKAVGFLGKTMNAVPIAMLVTGLLTLASEMGFFKSETELAAEQLERLNQAVETNQTLVKNISTRGAQKQDAEALAFINQQRQFNNSELAIEIELVEKLKKENLELLKVLQSKVYPSQIAFNAAKSKLNNLNQSGVDASGNKVASGNMSTIRNMYEQEFAAAEARLNQLKTEINLLKQSGLNRTDLIKRAQELMNVYKEKEGVTGKLFEENENLNTSYKKTEKVLDEIIRKESTIERVTPRASGVNTGGTMTTQEEADKIFEKAQREFEYFNDQKQEKEEKRIADQIQLAQDLTDITTFLTDRRIDAIDREIEAEKRKYDESKQRIDQIIAMRELDSNSMAQSIAFEKAEQAKALATQEKLQRKKQRLELLNTSISMLNAQVAAGNGNPLARTMSDVTALIGFIKSIPMFWEGTETTVGDTVGTKFSNGRDGILARVDKSEMVFNKSKVDKLAAMGIHSTDEVVKRLMLGNGISNVPTSMVAMNDNSDMVNELSQHRALLKQLVNKPQTHTTLEQVGKVVKMVETVNKPHRNVVTVQRKRI